MSSRVSTAAVFKRLRRSNGEVYMLREVADKMLELIESDEKMLAEYERVVNETKLAFEKFASEVSPARAAASRPTSVPAPGSCSSNTPGVETPPIRSED